MIAATVHCLPDIYWYCCMFIYCSLSIWGLLKVIIIPLLQIFQFLSSAFKHFKCMSQAMIARSPWERRLCFAPPFLMRMLVMTLRCFGIGGGSPDALLHIVLQVNIIIYFSFISCN